MITAFFSLVLVLVVAMLLCMAESARINACGRMADSILRLGTKSLLGSYDLALYENFHVFGRSAGGEEEAKAELSEEFSWYMQQNLSGNSWLCMQAKEATVTGIRTLTQENGEMFYAQAVQYEKFREVKEFLNWMLSALGEAEKAEKMGTLLQRTLQVQEGAAKAEETLSELLGCLDGFVVEEGSVVRSIFGKIQTESNFAKKLVPGGGGEWILPGNSELYKAQKNNYLDPSDLSGRIVSFESTIQNLGERLWELSEEYAKLAEDDTFQRETIQGEMSGVQQSIDSYRDRLTGEVARFWGEIGGTKAQMEKALELLARLEAERVAAQAELLAYREELAGFEGEVPDSIYTELEEQNEELLAHFSDGNAIGIVQDIRGMREALQHNISVLSEAKASQPPFFGTGSISAAGVGAAAQVLSGLRLRELVLAYDSVKVPEKSNPYTKMARQFFKYGVLSLVVDQTDKISNGKMGSEPLPSQLYEKVEKKPAFSFKKLFYGEREDVFSFQCGDISGFLKNGAQELFEEFLYLSYLKRHFAAYTDEVGIDAPEEDGEREGLLYQLEYIVAGERGDYDNLAEIAEKIFLLRFAMNAAVIFASGECRSQIKAAAVSAVGFTGIGALVMFVELLLAVLWAAECALTETGGLFLGGEVAFLPSAKALAVRFHELNKISKEFWQQKAEKYTEKEAGGILKSYREYLYLFLAVENTQLRTMRTMDVVQQVIRLKYQGDFLMQDCICAVETKVEFITPYLFLPVAGIHTGEGISRQRKYGISY